MKRFKSHFVFLVTGLHPAGGNKAVCAHPLCKLDTPDSVYHHHFFECVDYDSNRSFFRDYARQLFKESSISHPYLSLTLLESVLAELCPMWVGLLDSGLFLPGVKLREIHELHRIVTMASVFSRGGIYSLPLSLS